MPLPLIPVILIGTGVVTGAGGAVLGLKGGYEIKRANGRIRASVIGVFSEQKRWILVASIDQNHSLRSVGISNKSFQFCFRKLGYRTLHRCLGLDDGGQSSFLSGCFTRASYRRYALYGSVRSDYEPDRSIDRKPGWNYWRWR